MKRRRPTAAMADADEKRIAAARAIKNAAFNAALVGCPHDMGCGTWIGQHAAPELRDAYRAASAKLDAVEQATIDRGTMYRGGTFGSLYRIDWRR